LESPTDKLKDWNTPGKAEIEGLSFETINLTNDAKAQVDRSGDRTPIDVIMNVLNTTDEDSWDCYINHYEDYFWAELETANVSKYYQALGWDQTMWEENNPPRSEESEWFELNENEIIAAQSLCYFPDLWAGDVSISLWQCQPPEVQT
jgi:hypothetical protein